MLHGLSPLSICLRMHLFNKYLPFIFLCLCWFQGYKCKKHMDPISLFED